MFFWIETKNLIPKERVIGDRRSLFRVKPIWNNKVKVWYDAIRGKGAKPFVFPERINLTGELAEAIGLFVGDGSLRGNQSHSTFSNKDNELVKFILDFFLGLGVGIEDMSLSITYKKGDEERVKKWWGRKLGVKPDKFRIYQSDRSRYSTVDIQVNGAVFKIIFKKIVETILPLLRTSIELRRGFLRGLFAAEGCVCVKEGYINHISIAYNPKTEIELANYYKELFLKENIRTYDGSRGGEIIIRNWKDYYKLWEMRMFNLCTRKRERFIDIMRELKVGCTLETKFREELFNAFGLYQREIANLFGTYQASISKMVQGEFLPVIEQLIKASDYLGDTKFNKNNIKRNIIHIRIGNLTTLYDYSREFLDYLFELKKTSRRGSLCS